VGVSLFISNSYFVSLDMGPQFRLARSQPARFWPFELDGSRWSEGVISTFSRSFSPLH